MAQRAASAPNTVDRALQASLPGWHYFRGTHRQPCHTHNRPTEDMVDRQKREKMHAHKRGGPAIKTATRPRTMDRSSRTSSSRNSRNELEYQGSRLRQVTFHGERSRLPRSSRHLLSAARMLCRDRKRRTESRDSKRAKVMKAIPAKVLSGPLTFTCRAPHQKCWTAAWAQKHTCRLGYSPSWP